jgi:plastocyanin
MHKAWIPVLVVALALVGCGEGEEEADDTPAPGPNTTAASTGGGAAGGGGGAGGHDHGSPDCTGAASTSLKIVASNTTFDTNCLVGTANQPLTLSYENKDSANHGIVFLESHTSTDPFFRVDVFSGPRTQTVTIPAQRPGTYAFHCQVHPTAMSGTFVVK